MDAYVKTVLTVIAACLLLQVAQGFGVAGTPGSGRAESSSPEAAKGYVVQAIPMARLLLRFDPVTGRTWTAPLQLPRAREGRFWTPVDDGPAEPTVGEEDAPPRPDGAGGAEK